MDIFDREWASLQIDFLRGGEIKEFASALTAIEDAYSNLYALDLMIEQALNKAGGRFPLSQRKRSVSIRRIRNVEQVVLPEDRLRLTKANISSPGFLEFVGSLNPLETLRKYLQDRHERRKDYEYRENSEAERLALENEQLKQEVIMGRIEVLRELGVDEDRIRQAIAQHFFEPIEQLDSLQDRNLVEGARLLEPPKRER